METRMRNPLTLEAFADWAEKMPADEQYEWCDDSDCACGQYADAAKVSGSYRAHPHPSPDNAFWLKAEQAAFEWPRTFGSLAARLRAAV